MATQPLTVMVPVVPTMVRFATEKLPFTAAGPVISIVGCTMLPFVCHTPSTQ